MVNIPEEGTVEIQGTLKGFYKAQAPDLFGESFYKAALLELQDGNTLQVWIDIGFDCQNPGASLRPGDIIQGQVGKMLMDCGAGNVTALYSFEKTGVNPSLVPQAAPV